MRVLYVAPRYHTNQVPIMKGWLKNGHEIKFISQFAGTSEDYSVLNPVIFGYSRIFELLMKCYCLFFCRHQKTEMKEFAFRMKCGFPPLGKPGRLIRDFRPDLVILRERAVYNIPFYKSCKYRKIPCVLYNQSPLWDMPERDNGLFRKIFLKLLPQKRMTPVLGKKEDGKIRQPNTTFIPFVTEPHFSPDEKVHFLNGKIQVLCVGRYEERKNLLLLIKAIEPLLPMYGIHLTIVGEMLDDGQKEYYTRVEELIRKLSIDKDVTLLQNYSMEQVYEEYRKADLFVLPSTKERASVSQLEAMSCSLPVICSDTNGSACYVEDGVNGFLFRDNDINDLRKKMEIIISDRSHILDMGRNSYNLVKDRYRFQNYYKALMDIIMNRK